MNEVGLKNCHYGIRKAVKYYIIRLLAALLAMSSIGGGFLIGADHGMWAGFTTFIILLSLGIILHKAVDNKSQSSL
jgi:hypothetical protein